MGILVVFTLIRVNFPLTKENSPGSSKNNKNTRSFIGIWLGILVILPIDAGKYCILATNSSILLRFLYLFPWILFIFSYIWAIHLQIYYYLLDGGSIL